MSNAQFETYGPTPAHEPPGYGGFDPYSAQTLGYGVPSPYESRTDSYGTGYDRHAPHHQSYAAYEDTYRPAGQLGAPDRGRAGTD